MAESKSGMKNRLVERMVRNESIFCSMLFNDRNRTLRVVDFRGGNFVTKHSYLENVAKREGMRKIFTLTERDDMNGWLRVGFHREGSIPGYYKRSDAYIMSRILDKDFDAKSATSEDAPERKDFFIEVKEKAKEFQDQKTSGFTVEPVNEDDAVEAIEEECGRRNEKGGKAKGKAKAAKPKFIKSEMPPIFRQFSREVEYFYFIAQNKRSKQLNVVGAEFQDCFSNSKLDLFFSPTNKTEMSLAHAAIMSTVDQLAETGIVCLFSVVPAEDFNMSVAYASAGFRNTGFMHRQEITDDGFADYVVWTRKLI